jgi:hypothetical protein
MVRLGPISPCSPLRIEGGTNELFCPLLSSLVDAAVVASREASPAASSPFMLVIIMRLRLAPENLT